VGALVKNLDLSKESSLLNRATCGSG